MNAIIKHLQETLYKDFTLGALKITVILWAIFVIFLSIVVNDKWTLAGILAYEVLP